MSKAYFVRHEQRVPGVYESFFKPAAPLSYIAGQYADFRLPDIVDDPRGPGRTFTLASVPGNELVSIIYRYDEPASPYKQRLQSLQEGAEVQIGDIMGDLVLPKLPTIPLIFIAGGIGMASFTASLNWLQQRGEQRTIHLFYSLRNKYDDAFKDQVNNFHFASKQRYINPNRLNARDILQKVEQDTLVYLSGSERFVLGLRDSLHAAGLSHSQIIFDYYDGYAEL